MCTSDYTRNPDRLQLPTALGLQRSCKNDRFGGGVGHLILCKSKTPGTEDKRTQMATWPHQQNSTWGEGQQISDHSWE